jgi:hypothetical protein
MYKERLGVTTFAEDHYVSSVSQNEKPYRGNKIAPCLCEEPFFIIRGRRSGGEYPYGVLFPSCGGGISSSETPPSDYNLLVPHLRPWHSEVPPLIKTIIAIGEALSIIPVCLYNITYFKYTPFNYFVKGYACGYPHFDIIPNVLEWILLVRRKAAFRCEAGTRFFVFLEYSVEAV